METVAESGHGAGEVELPRHRYRSPEEDSGRWQGFEFRPGDIVISTRSKSGTTWLQMICALLVFERADLPAPLWDLSPWLDWLAQPIDDVRARLAAQTHRRIIKTHTPLDGLPIDPRVTYVVAGRHPLDQAVSLYHQGANIDRSRLADLTGGSATDPATATGPADDGPALVEWLRRWIDWDGDPRRSLDSLPGVMLHLGDAWQRRSRPNIVLVHYRDLVLTPTEEMARLAGAIGATVEVADRPDLVAAAGFDAMRARADVLVPDPVGVLKDRTAFFRRGRLGDGEAALDPPTVGRYRSRVAELGPPELVRWLHGETGRDR